MAKGDIYVARQSFTCDLDGIPIVVKAGQTRVRDGHEILNGRADMFEPLTVDYDIERATAAPGEKRTTKVKEDDKSKDD